MNFWPVGAILSGLIAYLMLNTLALPNNAFWRYGFALGGVLSLIVLFFRRRLPESPRWLATHGRLDEAEAIVARLERAAGVEPGPDEPTRQAEPVPVHRALVVLIRRYPARLGLGCALDLS